MGTQSPKGLRAMAVFLAFATTQIAFQFSFAAAPSSPTSPTATSLPPQFIARLATSGGSTTVNGLSAATGASVFTGARIQTPAAGFAMVDLGPLGSLDLSPVSDVKLDFDETGKTVKVTAFKGCFSLKTTKGTRGQVGTEQQENAAESNELAGGVINRCVGPTGLSQGAAPGAAAGGGGALGAGATAAIVIASLAVPATLYFTHRPDRNPSPSTP